MPNDFTSILSPDQCKLIETVEAAFRQAWADGSDPLVEDFLNDLPDILKKAALPRLIAFEVEARRAMGKAAEYGDYAKRFPDEPALLTELFSEIGDSRSTGTTKPLIGVRTDEQSTTIHQSENQEDRPIAHSLNDDEEIGSIPESFGRYRILRRIGRGGMGAVFLALDQSLDRHVALKIPIFRREDDSDAVERFYREARAMATVHHANLCPVYDVGRHERWHYLTMAYIKGRNLAVILKEEGVKPLNYSLTLLRKVASALHRAHGAGIIHRDLKPSNIMVTDDYEPMIMDFGLAQRIRPGEVELTQSGMVFGSPPYMAPEQIEARHNEIGPWTDVYALGVILFQMVTGKRPFDGSIMSIFGQVVTKEPPLPSDFLPGLSKDIDSICLRALSKSPAQRYASAAEFRDVLDRVLTGLPIDTANLSLRTIVVPESRTGTSVVSAVERTKRDAELRKLTVAVFNFEVDEATDDTSVSTMTEKMYEKSRTFASLVSDHVTRLGGSMVHSSGPEVIACFGYPQTYEDAPQRTVKVAVQVLRELGDRPEDDRLPLAKNAWVVVHSGESVAEMAEGPSGPGVSLVGDARDTALRISAVALPGKVTLSRKTHQEVSHYFECESLGPQRVRGLTQPVELFEVVKETASRNRVDLVDPGNLTPLVGRDTELSILKDRWEQALDSLGQIVLLIGEAGLGKSRLIRELREHVIVGDEENAAVIELRCSPYHQGTSFFPVAEFFSRLLDFEELSMPERLDAVVRYLKEANLDSAENVALFCGLLSVPTGDRYPALELSPQKKKQHIENLLLQWLRKMVQGGPVLFIVEDLHWLDPSTLELLEKHISTFESARLLSVFTFRPEFDSPWRSKPHLTQIALNRLTSRQIGEMMRKRTGRGDLPQTIVQQVKERTDGIPLFIEEFTALIVESGILDRAESDSDSFMLLNVIPSTLRDLLLSRLDRMEADHDVIQLAAAIGREFSFNLLSASSSLPPEKLRNEIDKLFRSEILFRKGEDDEAVYIFKHALLQDAAYRSMLTGKRRAVHRRIADALETHFGAVADAQPALLAHHCSEAGQTERAVRYWLKAGLKSQEQSAVVESARQFERGIELCKNLEPGPDRDMLELELRLPYSAVLMALKGYAAEDVEPVQNRCIEICRSFDAKAPLFSVLIATWEWLFIRGRFQDCEIRCREIIDLAHTLEGPGMIAEAYWTSNCTAYYAGDFQTGHDHSLIGIRNHHRAASIEYVKVTQQNSGPLNLTYHGLALWQLGYPEQGRRFMDQGYEMATELNHLFTLAMTTWKLAQFYDIAGIGDKTLMYSERVLEIANQQGFAFWTALGNGCKGIGLKHLGRYDESIDVLRTSLRQLDTTGSFILFPKFRAHLADALRLSGAYDEGLRQLEQAFADQTGGEYFMHAELLRMRGDFHFERQDFANAEAAYLEAIGVARSQHARMFELRNTLRLCDVFRKTHRHDSIRPLLEPLLSGFTEGFDMPDLKEARAVLAQC